MEYAESDVLETDLEQVMLGPREDAVQLCIIKRDKRTSTYKLCQCLGPPLAMEEGQFSLAARKVWRATSIEYLIFSDPDMSRGSVVGKLRSNFLGTKFTIYECSEQLQNRAAFSTSHTSRIRRSFNETSPRAHVAYRLHISSPREMQCTLHRIPASAMDPNGSPPNPTRVESASTFNVDDSTFFSPQSNLAGGDWSVADSESMSIGLLRKDHAPLVLKSKAPLWNDQVQAWCLNFRDHRVTVASLKNFQLVDAANEQNQTSSERNDLDKVLLQFGEIGEDKFTMDYCYPLSAFDAFAIFLSSVDEIGKLGEYLR